MTSDHLQRFLFKDSPIRGQLVRLNASLHDAILYQNIAPELKSLFIECLTASPLLAGTIKTNTRVNLQIQNKDQSKLMLSQCNQHHGIRGYLRWPDDAKSIENNPLEAFTPGFVLITLIPEAKGERYEGITELNSQSIAHSLMDYFRQSEQIPTWILIATDEQHSAALLLQILPSHADEQKTLATWEEVLLFAETLSHQELLHYDNPTLLSKLFAEYQIQLFNEEPIQFSCQCSTERMITTIQSLSPAEVESLVSEHKTIDIRCEFCGKNYVLDSEELLSIRRG